MKRYTTIFILTFLLLLPSAILFNKLSFSEPFSCPQGGVVNLKSSPITQSFIPFKENLTVLSIKTATYTNPFIIGKVNFSITDKNDQQVFSKDVSMLWFSDNGFYDIRVPEGKLNKGEEYFLSISYSKKPKESFGFWTTKGDCYDGNLIIKNKSNDYDLMMIKKYSQKNTLAGFNELLNRISQYKPIWIKGNAVVTIIIVYLTLCVAAIIVFVRKIF